jgi:AcrR family transcriptional regulator
MIAAMVAACAEQSYAETTIADVVAGAHVSRTTFYREFADKRACFDAAVAAAIAELSEAAKAELDAERAPAAQVRAATAAMLELMARRPQLAQLLVGEAVAVEPATVDRHREILLPSVAAIWREAGADGATHCDPVTAFGRVQLLIFERVAAGEAERLPELLPEVVYLATGPFAGHEAAIAEARACAEDAATATAVAVATAGAQR